MPSVFDQMTAPPAAELLGWELIAEHPDSGTLLARATSSAVAVPLG